LKRVTFRNVENIRRWYVRYESGFKQLRQYQELMAWPTETGLENMHAESLEFFPQTKSSLKKNVVFSERIKMLVHFSSQNMIESIFFSTRHKPVQKYQLISLLVVLQYKTCHIMIWYMIWYTIWYMIWYIILYDMIDTIWYDVMILYYDMIFWYDIWYDTIRYDIFNCNWVDTRWQ
jgi:hypothetical protein